MMTHQSKTVLRAGLLAFALGLSALPNLAQPAPIEAVDAAPALSETRLRINEMLTALKRSMPNRDVNAIAKQAEKAFEADESSIDARLDYATAMWLQGRQLGKMSGYMRGLPQTSRRVLEEALEMSPEHAGVLAQIGVWNMDVFRRGGASGAKRLGADFETGLGYWRQAQALDPNDLGMSLHGAFILLAMEDDAYTEEATETLQRVAVANARTPLDISLAERAQTVLELLESDDQDAVQKSLNTWLGKK